MDFVFVFRFLFLRLVHHLRPQCGHRRISNHQRPDLQVAQFTVQDNSQILVTVTSHLSDPSAGTCTKKVVWQPRVTSLSRSPPPFCQNFPLSIHPTFSSHTESGEWPFDHLLHEFSSLQSSLVIPWLLQGLRCRAALHLTQPVSSTAATGKSQHLMATWKRFRDLESLVRCPVGPLPHTP